MKTSVKAALYMVVLTVLSLLGLYLLIATVWSVADSRALSCVILTLEMVVVILADIAIARCWKNQNGLYAFQAILVYLRFRKDGNSFAQRSGDERTLKFLRCVPGLEERAAPETAAALYAWGEELTGRKGR